MRYFTCLSTLAAAVATTVFTPASHAEFSQRYETQLAVSSVVQCGIEVTAEAGRVMAAKYEYTAEDQTAGAYGTTTLTTSTPLPILVSAAPDTCKLPKFTVTTTQPGTKIGNYLYGLDTKQGGVWPLKWMYAALDDYDDAKGTEASYIRTDIYVSDATGNKVYDSSSTFPPCGQPAGGWTVVGAAAAAENRYGTYEHGYVPALSTAPNGGHMMDRAHGTHCTPIEQTTGLDFAGLLAVHGGVAGGQGFRTLTVLPPPSARSVRIELAQLIATFPYGPTTKAPAPLTVYNGETLTGTGTMTITPL